MASKEHSYGSNEVFKGESEGLPTIPIDSPKLAKSVRLSGVLTGVFAVLARTLSRSFSSVFSAHLNQTQGFSSVQFWMFLAISAALMTLLSSLFGSSSLRNDVRKGLVQLCPRFGGLNPEGLELSEWANLMIASVGSDLGFLFVSLSVMYISAGDSWALGVGMSAVMTPLSVACIFGWNTLTMRLMIAIVLCISGTICICRPSFLFSSDRSLNAAGVVFALLNAVTELKNVSIQWLRRRTGIDGSEATAPMNDRVLTFSRLILSAALTLAICVPYFTLIAPHSWIQPWTLPKSDALVFSLVALLDTLSVFGVTVAVSNLGANGFTIGRQTLLIFALLFENVVYHSSKSDLSLLTLLGMSLTLAGVAVSVLDRMDKDAASVASQNGEIASETDGLLGTLAVQEYEVVSEGEGEITTTTDLCNHHTYHCTDVDIYDDHIERI